ncbi:MAG TPA: hypothetical protein VIM55_00155 [Mucilaginibacter sp.]
MRKPLTYLILTIVTIIIGLLSRHFKAIPLFIGDILWATMVYFIMRFLFISKTIRYNSQRYFLLRDRIQSALPGAMDKHIAAYIARQAGFG